MVFLKYDKETIISIFFFQIKNFNLLDKVIVIYCFEANYMVSLVNMKDLESTFWWDERKDVQEV